MPGGEKAEETPKEEAPAWLSFALAVVSAQYRPTIVTLVAIGVFGAGVFWVDSRAQGYVRDAARSSIEPVELRTTAAEKLLEGQDARMREVEKSLAEMNANLRSVKEDVHELRERNRP